MNDLISVIIPVFNAEKYIDRCIQSLLNQTYKNIEIIIINDKSTDNTFNKLNKYSNNFNIRIINNKKNQGVSKTRNNGLKICKRRIYYVC